MNPLIPTPGEMLVLLAGLLTVVLWLVAVVSLAKDRYYTPSQRLLWVLLVLAAPPDRLGAVADHRATPERVGHVITKRLAFFYIENTASPQP